MLRQIRIEDLSLSCIMRSSGQEAARKLEECFGITEHIEIDLNNVEIVSMSFLDELIYRLYESTNLDKVIFRVCDVFIKDKLERIAQIRSVRIRYRSGEEGISIATPRSPILHEATLAITKT